MAVAALGTIAVRGTRHALAASYLVALGTVHDLVDATRAVSSTGFYTPLAATLDAIPGVENYRVEVVNHGAHAGYDALLGHVMLARGWETQEDRALNRSLAENPLSPVTYKVWAGQQRGRVRRAPVVVGGPFSEYDLVRSGTSYLRLVWSSPELAVVPGAAPDAHRGGAGAAAAALAVGAHRLDPVRPHRARPGAVVEVPGRPAHPGTAAAGIDEPATARPLTPHVSARVRNDGSHWTTVTTTRAGTYQLRGSLRRLLR